MAVGGVAKFSAVDLTHDGRTRPGSIHAWVLGMVVVVAASTAIGNRDPKIGADTAGYLAAYESVLRCGCETAILDTEPGFRLLTQVVAALGLSGAEYLAILALLQFSCWVAAARVLLIDVLRAGEWAAYSILTVTLFLLNPFFWAATLNVLRTGLAVPLVILGVGFAWRRRYRGAAIAWAVATLIQFPTAMSIILSFLAVVRLSRRTAVLLVGALSALYALGAPEQVIGQLVRFLPTDIADSLTTPVAGYRSGVRLDFLVAALAAFTLLCWLAGRTSLSTQITRLLTALLLPFLLLGWTAFSDRWLLAFWLAAPGVLAYEVLRLTGARATFAVGVLMTAPGLMMMVAVLQWE